MDMKFFSIVKKKMNFLFAMEILKEEFIPMRIKA